MNIGVMGCGYVGLVTGAVFADMGNDVAAVEIDQPKLAMLKAGEMPIFEPGLEEMVRRNLKEQRLAFTDDAGAAIERSDVIFIAVGTPPKSNGETDLSQVEAAARTIAAHMNRYKVVVNKSTVPVGTGNLVRRIIDQEKSDPEVKFDVVSNPEFLREGSAIQDTLYPDRIVIGAPNKDVAMILLELYHSLERPMLLTDVASAEIIKYASNAFLATKISFINTIADLCERAGADVTQVAKGIGADHRIGSHFLQAGLGYGGSCFPKDVDSLIHTAAQLGIDVEILRAVTQVNRTRVDHFVSRVETEMGPVSGKTIGILGLAFKPETDDMREAKSIEIIARLVELGAIVKAYDPVAMEKARPLLPASVTLTKNAYEAAEGAHAIALLTEWREFKQISFDRLKKLMQDPPFMFDGRNFYTSDRRRLQGFRYFGVGK